MDEPGNDVQWYFSENHALLFHTSAYLAGHLLPASTFVRSGRKGAEQSAVGATRVRAWLDHFEAWEMAEFNSAPYFPIDLKGLTALAALAPDADIAERARRASCACARSSRARPTTAWSRPRRAAPTSTRFAPAARSSCRALPACCGARAGTVAASTPCRSLPSACAIMASSCPRRCRPIASHQGDANQEWCFAQGENSFAALYHYKGRDFAMGSAAHYRWNEWGYQETVLHLRLGKLPEARSGSTIRARRSSSATAGRPTGAAAGRCRAPTSIAGSPCSTFPPSTSSRISPMPGSRVAEFEESRVAGSLALAQER